MRKGERARKEKGGKGILIQAQSRGGGVGHKDKGRVLSRPIEREKRGKDSEEKRKSSRPAESVRP